MAVSNGQRNSAENFNAAFLSRTVDSDTVAIIGLNNPSSGGLIVNAQQKINDIDVASLANAAQIVVLQSTKENISDKGQPNGYAELDALGKIPSSQLTTEAMEYKGVWDASTNTPTLADGAGDTGDVYRVSVAGDLDLGSGTISFGVGDWVTYNGAIYERSDFGIQTENIGDLGDVDTTGVVDGNALVWNNTAMEFQPGDVSSIAQEDIAFIGKGSGDWSAPTVGGSPTSVAANADESATITFEFNRDQGFTFKPSTTSVFNTFVSKMSDTGGTGNGDGTVVATLFATSGGLPTGAALDTSPGLVSSNITGISPATLTHNFNFSGAVPLTVGVEYAILLNHTDTGTLNIRTGAANDADTSNVQEITAGSNTYQLNASQNTISHDIIATPTTTPGALILDEDCFISVPPLPNSYHTIDAQTININNDQCAYVTIDRAAVVTTSLTVTVDDIVNVTPDNDIIIFARCVVDEAYVGLKDPQRFSDNDSFELQKGGGGAAAAGVGTYDRFNSDGMTDITATANATLLPTNTGAGVGTYTWYYQQQIGDCLHIAFRYFQGGTAGTGGSIVGFPYPDALTPKISNQVSLAAITFGVDHNITQDSAADQWMATGVQTSTSQGMIIKRMGTGSSIGGVHFAANSQVQVEILIPVVEYDTHTVSPITLGPATPEYLESVYTDSTVNMNSPSAYITPGASEFDLPLTAGTWDVGYDCEMLLQILTGTGTPAGLQATGALHLDGIKIEDTESYSSATINTSFGGGVYKMSGRIEVTIVSPQSLQLRFQSSDPGANQRVRLCPVGFSATLAGDDSAPKLWARRVS